MKALRSVTFLVLFAILGAKESRGETWPTLEMYVDWCVLIVLCETEEFDEGVRYKVKEQWKGVYSPDLFHHKPEEGYLYANTWHGNEKPKAGEQTVFFFTAGNHPVWTKGRLLDHSTSFRVIDGKVIYASTGNWGVRKEYSINDFRKEVARHLRAQYAESVRLKVTGGETSIAAKPKRAEQDGAGQPATASESKPEGESKTKPESEGRSQ
ncbi:MAG: hypothetical protein AAF065_06135 [Verrucomicrobiota bacterium]